MLVGVRDQDLAQWKSMCLGRGVSEHLLGPTAEAEYPLVGVGDDNRFGCKFKDGVQCTAGYGSKLHYVESHAGRTFR